MLFLVFRIVKGNSFKINKNMKIVFLLVSIVFFYIETLLLDDYKIVYGSISLIGAIALAAGFLNSPYLIVKRKEYSNRLNK